MKKHKLRLPDVAPISFATSGARSLQGVETNAAGDDTTCPAPTQPAWSEYGTCWGTFCDTTSC